MVVAMHMQPVEFHPLVLLGGEVNITGSRIYCNDFPKVIALMERGAYPLDGWVSTVPFDGFIDRGIVPLNDQQAMKILIDVAGASAASR